MFRSLHMKLVLIMLLLITSLMTVVGTFMMTNITGFYIDEFYQQVENVFGGSNPANAAFVNTLRREAAQPDGHQNLREIIEAKAGDLGLNSNTRNYYILDGRTGAFLGGSNDQSGLESLPTTPNLLTARAAVAAGEETVGSSSDVTANYMDVAIPIIGGENAYIIYIYDPRDMENNFLDIIISETDRMTRIVQDLLTLSRLDSGRAEIKMARFSLLDAIESVCRAVELEAQRRGHTLLRLYGDTLPMIMGDRSRLEQVMMNVVGNSIKYTPDGGTISVDAGVRGGKVWIEVSDNGIGIPPKDRERIFDRFYRVDKARSRESGGTGLGLSIAREIVLRHGGSIALTAHDGPGTTVRIVLPIRQSGEARHE